MYRDQASYDSASANKLWQRFRAGEPISSDADELVSIWSWAAGSIVTAEEHRIRDYVAAKLQLPPGVEPTINPSWSNNPAQPRWLAVART